MLYKEFKFNLSNFFVSMHAQFKYFHIFRFSTGNNTGAIVGGTIAGLVVVAIILFIIYHSDRKKKGLPIVPPKVTNCWNQTKQFIKQPRLPRFIRQLNRQSNSQPARTVPESNSQPARPAPQSNSQPNPSTQPSEPTQPLTNSQPSESSTTCSCNGSCLVKSSNICSIV